MTAPTGTGSLPAVVPDLTTGLTAHQVADRLERGLANEAPDARSRSLRDIVRANTFTWFNGLLGTLWLIMIFVAPPQDALFGFVIVFNTGIGIVQEYRASRELAKLSVIGEIRPTVIRDGREVQVGVAEVVRDDLIVLNSGDQLVVDGSITTSLGLEVDESLLTGEADPVGKSPGDNAMSGSFVVSGSGVMHAERVGAESFAAGLTAAARHYSAASSELRDSVQRFIRFVSFLIVPIGALLLISQLRAEQSIADAIRGSIAGMVTMIPEGLVLLTSIAMAVGVIRLARRRALVQEVPAVEALARTDVVCVDKTGTLTDPGMALHSVQPLSGDPEAVSSTDPRRSGGCGPKPQPDHGRDPGGVSGPRLETVRCGAVLLRPEMVGGLVRRAGQFRHRSPRGAGPATGGRALVAGDASTC